MGFLGDLFTPTPVTRSSIRNESNQLYINKSDFTQMSKQLNEVVANTIVENAMKSGANVIGSQKISFGNIKAKGDIDIGDISQKSTIAITFDAINKTQTANESASKFVQQAMEDMKNMATADALVKMESNAEAKAVAGALSTSSAAANTDVVNITNITSVTENTKNISKILENKVQNNFTTKNITECITSANQQQVVETKDIESAEGSVKIHNLSQEQSVTMISKCSSLVDATNKILTETMDVLGIKVDETNSIKTETENKTVAKSESENTGLIDGILNGISKIFSLDSVFSIIVVAIIGLLIIGGIVFFVMRSNGKIPNNVSLTKGIKNTFIPKKL